jgi:hypothetical protein
MLRQSLIASALALAVASASSGIGAADAATSRRASLDHLYSRAPASASSYHRHEAPYHETGEIPWSPIG